MFNPSDEAWSYEDMAPLSSRLPGLATITAGLPRAQVDAASHDGAILLLAGAGIGKRRMLTARGACSVLTEL